MKLVMYTFVPNSQKIDPFNASFHVTATGFAPDAGTPLPLVPRPDFYSGSMYWIWVCNNEQM
jgi:hypothetical protein